MFDTPDTQCPKAEALFILCIYFCVVNVHTLMFSFPPLVIVLNCKTNTFRKINVDSCALFLPA